MIQTELRTREHDHGEDRAVGERDAVPAVLAALRIWEVMIFVAGVRKTTVADRRHAPGEASR